MADFDQNILDRAFIRVQIGRRVYQNVPLVSADVVVYIHVIITLFVVFKFWSPHREFL